MQELLQIIERTGSFILDSTQIKEEFIFPYRKYVRDAWNRLKEDLNTPVEPSLIFQPLEEDAEELTTNIFLHVSRLLSHITILSLESKDFGDQLLTAWRFSLKYSRLVFKRFLSQTM